MDTEPPAGELFNFSHLILSSFFTTSIGIGLVLLLFLSALISASEVAFFSLSPQDIDDLNKEDSPRSNRILKLKEQPRRLLATILIANNFINIAIIILSARLILALLSETTLLAWAQGLKGALNIDVFTALEIASGLNFIITVIGVTFLLVLFGEVAPKIYANIHNVRHAKMMSSPLHLLTRICYPFSTMLLKWSGGIEERVYQRRLASGGSTDKKELDRAIELTVSESEGQNAVDILKGIIKFGDVVTKQIMRSRVDVVGLDINDDFKTVIKTIKDSGYSRLPVFQEDFDTLKGILYVKDLLGFTDQGVDFDWQTKIREHVLYVPETKKIIDLLKEFQSKRTHMGIVVDEYGGSAGIVTLEDIMEEVVGDIKDEFDQGDDVDYTKVDDHNYIFEGKTLLNDVARILDIDADLFDEVRGNADSLAGLILEIEGHIPKHDREINYRHLKLKILSVTYRRIERVNIYI